MAYNILIFGGTTEGLRVASLLDALGEPYLYSTKTKTQQVVKGEVLIGAKSPEVLQALIIERNIKCIIDAAHPFAEVLHQMVLEVATTMGIPTVCYERIFPSLKQVGIVVFNSYDELQEHLLQHKYESILALTGVQTIAKLPSIWDRTHFRILNTAKSLSIATASGIALDRITQADPSDSVAEIIDLAQEHKAQAILTKESGVTGFFDSKVKAAQQLNIPLLVVKRRILEGYTHSVTTQKELHQLILNLRKSALKTENLRSGYTTGSTLTAATQAAFLSLMLKEARTQEKVEIACGEMVDFLVYEDNKTDDSSSYIAIKDGGDDADVTHAQDIGCTVSLQKEQGVRLIQGEGIGRVTLPGLQIEVGQPAINPVPRKMITFMLQHFAEVYHYEGGIEVQPFVPRGRELAKKTFNPRVGVIDGISIIGTTGKVMPYSADAFVGAIKKQLDVAQESQFDGVLATSGLRSENIVLPLLEGQHTAVHFGNFVGETLTLCRSVKVKKIAVGIMLGKAIKLAEGQMDTHSKKATFNKDFVIELLTSCHYTSDIIEQARKIQLANELTSIIPFSVDEAFYARIAALCYSNCDALLGEENALQLYLLSSNHDHVIMKSRDTLVGI